MSHLKRVYIFIPFYTYNLQYEKQNKNIIKSEKKMSSWMDTAKTPVMCGEDTSVEMLVKSQLVFVLFCSTSFCCHEEGKKNIQTWKQFYKSPVKCCLGSQLINENYFLYCFCSPGPRLLSLCIKDSDCNISEYIIFVVIVQRCTFTCLFVVLFWTC